MVIKKTLNEKKYIYAFFNKKPPLYARLGSKQKLLATAKQLIRKKEICLLFKKSGNFFHRANVKKIGLNPLPLFIFIHFLRTPSPSTLNVFFEWVPIIMSNANNLGICPFIKVLIWEQHHYLAIICCHCLVNSLVFISFAAKLVSLYDVIHFREKKGFEFLTVPSFNKLYTV